MERQGQLVRDDIGVKVRTYPIKIVEHSQDRGDLPQPRASLDQLGTYVSFCAYDASLWRTPAERGPFLQGASKALAKV
jgi:hypothetical protein